MSENTEKTESKWLGWNGLLKLVERIKAYDAASLTIAKEYTDEKVAENKVTVDSSLSSTSTNPVQNQALKSKFDEVDSFISQKSQVQIITWEADD